MACSFLGPMTPSPPLPDPTYISVTTNPSAPADRVVHTGLHARTHMHAPDPFPSSLQDPACLRQWVGSGRDLRRVRRQ